jgi:hypothetical protein
LKISEAKPEFADGVLSVVGLERANIEIEVPIQMAVLVAISFIHYGAIPTLFIPI